MSLIRDLMALEASMDRELRDSILPYWMHRMVDSVHGGFYGRITGENIVDAKAPKSAILNGRILWTFSAAFRVYGAETYRTMADRAYHYMQRHFWDAEHGGVYWMLDHRGEPIETKKHSYAQAFAIYGYSEYFRATGHRQALDRAMELFRLLDQAGWLGTQRAYYEAFDRQWGRLEDVRLSDVDEDQVRSTNTHLHILEAFASLYRIWPDPVLRDRLSALVDVFHDTVYNTDHHHFHTFFDEGWTSKSDVYSYGHDIETSWLLSEALCALGVETEASDRQTKLLGEVADTVLDEGMNAASGGVFNSGKDGSVADTDHQWWAQAEAVVGFVNAFQATEDDRYAKAALKIWDFIQSEIIDAENGEWFFRVDREGNAYRHEDKAGPWKCPYHTSRACMEIKRRIAQMGASDGVAVEELPPRTRVPNERLS